MQFTKECDPTGFWTKQVMGEEIVGPYDVYADPEKGGHAFEVVNAILLRDALVIVPTPLPGVGAMAGVMVDMMVGVGWTQA